MEKTRRQWLAERALEMRRSMTYAEKKLWMHFLREYPVSFVAQKVIDPYILDFYCRKARLSIEIDGNTHFTAEQQQYDETRTIFLEMFEIKELRFTNTEVYENFEGVCEIIDREVMLRRNDLPSDNFKKLLQKR